MNTTAKDANLMPDMSHHRSPLPTKPPTAIPGQYLKPSEMGIGHTFLHHAARDYEPETTLSTIVEEAPTRLPDGAHPTTRMAVSALEWHARELELLRPGAEDSTQMLLALGVAIDALEAAAAVLKSLQRRRAP